MLEETILQLGVAGVSVYLMYDLNRNALAKLTAAIEKLEKKL